jgi:AcrR family transcriptional regulator
MPPRLDVSAIRRDQILTAARALFVARGVTAARLDEIAVQLDVSKAALYLYYPGKDAIVAAVLDQQSARMAVDLKIAAITHAPPFERLLAVVSAMQSPDFPIRLRSEIVGLSCVSEPVAQALRHFHNVILEQLVALFAEFSRKGEFFGLEPDVAARRVLYLSEGILLVRATVDEPHTVAAEAEAILRSFAASHMRLGHQSAAAEA